MLVMPEVSLLSSLKGKTRDKNILEDENHVMFTWRSENNSSGMRNDR